MKRILASVGLVALGASSLNAQYAPGLSAIEKEKPWTVSAALRGFYDDNYLTLQDNERDSIGLDFSPSVSINHSAENTLVGGSYVYDLKHYEDDGHTDQSHQFNAKFDHAFTENYKLRIEDSFVIGQQPEVLAGGNNAAVTKLRIDGSNIRNTGSIGFFAGLTENLGIDLSYANSIYSYDNETYSTLLDRMEHSIDPSLRWKLSQKTTAILGYEFGLHEYDNFSARDNRSHFVKVGVDHDFTAQLRASARVGAQFTDYYNSDATATSPYADANLQWTYKEGCVAQAGIKQIRNATDLIGVLATNPVLDESSTVPYLSITHKITPKLTASGMAQYQMSEFKGGSLDGSKEDFLTLDLNLAYQFTPYLMAETGYTFNDLTSDGGREYTRNIAYLGLRVSY